MEKNIVLLSRASVVWHFQNWICETWQLEIEPFHQQEGAETWRVGHATWSVRKKRSTPRRALMNTSYLYHRERENTSQNKFCRLADAPRRRASVNTPKTCSKSERVEFFLTNQLLHSSHDFIDSVQRDAVECVLSITNALLFATPGCATSVSDHRSQ